MTAPPSSERSDQVTVQEFFEALQKRIEVQLLCGHSGLHRELHSHRIQKLGLGLAGFVDYLHQDRAQFIGRSEMGYFATLTPEQGRRALEAIFARDLSCLVVTTGLSLANDFLDLAEQHSTPILWTPIVSSKAISEVTTCLEEFLAPTLSVHASLVDVFGLGVLLQGASGVGKSECALDLVLKGHRIISDDLVEIRRFEGQGLVGQRPSTFPFLMEVRGLGILDVKDLFGISAVLPRKTIELAVHLRYGQELSDRLGLEQDEQSFLDVLVPRITIPVIAGRNLATLVEVAVRLQLLRQQGYDSTRTLVEDLEERLKQD